MVLAATVFGLCLWPGLQAKRFTLGTVSFLSDWIIFVFKFRFFKNLAKIFSFSVVVLLVHTCGVHINVEMHILVHNFLVQTTIHESELWQLNQSNIFRIVPFSNETGITIGCLDFFKTINISFYSNNS